MNQTDEQQAHQVVEGSNPIADTLSTVNGSLSTEDFKVIPIGIGTVGTTSSNRKDHDDFKVTTAVGTTSSHSEQRR